MVADLEFGDAGTDLLHDAAAFVTEYGAEPIWVSRPFHPNAVQSPPSASAHRARKTTSTARRRAQVKRA